MHTYETLAPYQRLRSGMGTLKHLMTDRRMFHKRTGDRAGGGVTRGAPLVGFWTCLPHTPLANLIDPLPLEARPYQLVASPVPFCIEKLEQIFATILNVKRIEILLPVCTTLNLIYTLN